MTDNASLPPMDRPDEDRAQLERITMEWDRVTRRLQAFYDGTWMVTFREDARPSLGYVLAAVTAARLGMPRRPRAHCSMHGPFPIDGECSVCGVTTQGGSKLDRHPAREPSAG